MRVLFLALGGTRRRDVTAELAEVVRDGGSATVVIDRPGPWKNFPLPPEAQVLTVADLERRHPVGYLEWLLLDKIPNAILRRAERGPIQRVVGRLRRAYRRRLLRPLQRRSFATYMRVRGDIRHALVIRHGIAGATFDMLVVSDPHSIPVAMKIHDSLTSQSAHTPLVTFGYHRSMFEERSASV